MAIETRDGSNNNSEQEKQPMSGKERRRAIVGLVGSGLLTIGTFIFAVQECIIALQQEQLQLIDQSQWHPAKFWLGIMLTVVSADRVGKFYNKLKKPRQSY